jgi:hypothetical protein
MPIKSSGQLSLRNDIRPEFGASTSNISLRNLSSRAGFSTPDAMSEFYGFSFGYYFNTRRGVVRNTGTNSNDTQRLTYSGWFRVDSISKKDQIFFGGGRDTGTRNRVCKVWYYARFNRLVVEIFDTRSTRRMRRQYPLHNSPNVQITGVTNSSVGWERDQRGNTDSNGFVHICVTLDISSRSYTGIKLYWNGQELTYSVNNQSSSITPYVTNRRFCIGLDPGTPVGSASNFEGGIDNVIWLGQSTLNSVDVRGLYDAGNSFQVPSPPPPYLYNGAGGTSAFVYGGQGFENGINNNSGWLLGVFGQWEFAGSAYSIQSY